MQTATLTIAAVFASALVLTAVVAAACGAWGVLAGAAGLSCLTSVVLDAAQALCR